MPKLTSFANRLLSEWKQLGLPVGDATIVIAVSGGADSTALLLAVDELQKAQRLALGVVVAHLEHGLRGESSRDDARWVAELSGKLGYEVDVEAVDVKARAALSRDNLEQAARVARHEFLGNVALRRHARVLLTGHTLDDQAETVLLRLLRGSGADGLSGMKAVRKLQPSDDIRADILLVRPLLGWARRNATADYCTSCGIKFQVDETNADESLRRVWVRRKLMPLLEEANPRVVETLGRTAAVLGEDAAWLDTQAANLLRCASVLGGHSVAVGAAAVAPPLSVVVLRQAGVALRRRALRLWIKGGRGSLRRLEQNHVVAVERLLDGERDGRLAELPDGCRIERRRGQLILRCQEKIDGVTS